MPHRYRFIAHSNGDQTLVEDTDVFLDRLRDHFQYLHETSAHYHSVMQRLGLSPALPPIDLLQAMPPTEKETYRDILQLEALSRLNGQTFVTDYSSGSTARCVLRLCTPADDLGEQEVTETVFRRAGMGPEDRLVCMDVGAPEIYDFYFRAARTLGLRRMSYLNLVQDYTWSVKPLAALAPTVLLTVPSLLVRAWPSLRDLWPEGESPVKVILHIGEPMHPEFRREVSEAWGCRILSFYGTTEIGGIGCECEPDRGIHFDPALVFPTLMQARQVDEMTMEGEVLFTTLHVRTQSVVKYNVGDRVRLTTAPCRCGEDLPRLFFIERTHDAFVIAGEKFRYEAIFEALKSAVPELQLLSIHISDLPAGEGDALLRVVLPQDLKAREKELLGVLEGSVFELDSLHHYGLVRFELDFQPLDYFRERKLKRIVDTRRHLGEPVS